MAITKKNIVDDIKLVLSRFVTTDDTRLNFNWMSYKIDQVRAQLIVKSYDEKKIIDQAWLSDLGVVDFYEVNFADDPTVNYCCSDISKSVIPKIIEVGDEHDNVDIGLYALMSVCGKNKFYKKSIELWRDIPSEHIYSKFNFYFRINNSLYVNKKIDKARIVAILENPEEGYYMNTQPITTISTGVTYVVKDAQIFYNNVFYQPDDTFVGVTGKTTFTGKGKVYLNSFKQSIDIDKPYPVNSDMARQILIEICTKEFRIEESQLADIDNDSKDEQIPENKKVQQ